MGIRRKFSRRGRTVVTKKAKKTKICTYIKKIRKIGVGKCPHLSWRHPWSTGKHKIVYTKLTNYMLLCIMFNRPDLSYFLTRARK
jgi:hypothetical protein